MGLGSKHVRTPSFVGLSPNNRGKKINQAKTIGSSALAEDQFVSNWSSALVKDQFVSNWSSVESVPEKKTKEKQSGLRLAMSCSASELVYHRGSVPNEHVNWWETSQSVCDFFFSPIRQNASLHLGGVCLFEVVLLTFLQGLRISWLLQSHFSLLMKGSQVVLIAINSHYPIH